jgi:hypothetical protein
MCEAAKVLQGLQSHGGKKIPLTFSNNSTSALHTLSYRFVIKVKSRRFKSRVGFEVHKTNGMRNSVDFLLPSITYILYQLMIAIHHHLTAVVSNLEFHLNPVSDTLYGTSISIFCGPICYRADKT